MQNISDTMAHSEHRFTGRWSGVLPPAYGVIAVLLLGAVAVLPDALARTNSHRAADGADGHAVVSFGRHVTLPRACAVWDQSASTAMAALNETSSASIGSKDAEFRLHRARRNCAAGWPKLACGDYQVILTGTLPPSDGQWRRLDPSKTCSLAMIDKN